MAGQDGFRVFGSFPLLHQVRGYLPGTQVAFTGFRATVRERLMSLETGQEVVIGSRSYLWAGNSCAGPEPGCSFPVVLLPDGTECLVFVEDWVDYLRNLNLQEVLVEV